jgi:uncharacterized RDD family membrane protein YckC
MTDQSFFAPEAAATSTTTSERAGFWMRFGATLVDSFVLGVVCIPLQLALDSTGEALSSVVVIAYCIYCEGSERGQTLGKAAFGIRVRSTGGGPLGYGRAFLRYVGRILSTIPLLLGYFWMLWDPNKQTWHDKIANSVVVPAPR